MAQEPEEEEPEPGSERLGMSGRECIQREVGGKWHKLGLERQRDLGKG